MRVKKSGPAPTPDGAASPQLILEAFPRTATVQRAQAVVGEDGLPATGFIREEQVLRLLPFSRSTWWAGVKERRHPAPVKLSPRVTAWAVEDIRALLKQFRANEGVKR